MKVDESYFVKCDTEIPSSADIVDSCGAILISGHVSMSVDSKRY